LGGSQVIEKDERHREVKASVKLRLMEIEEEIKGEPAIPAATATVDSAPEPRGTSVEAHRVVEGKGRRYRETIS